MNNLNGFEILLQDFHFLSERWVRYNKHGVSIILKNALPVILEFENSRLANMKPLS